MSITIKVKTNYLVIPAVTLLVMFLGGFYTWCGMQWYRTLTLPAIMPEDWVIRTVWHIIYAFTTTAAVLAFNRFERNNKFYLLMGLFCCNAFLNVYWSYLFFYKHLIGAALLSALALELTTLAILALISDFSRAISLLLLPYAMWNLFAIVLNFMIWRLN
ncbi:MAG TPA: TspO/MBR family protein [Candidatus Babeliales bacterium]|nr:TspO/MBR family protein [Candidatus Babeliales bacterium]